MKKTILLLTISLAAAVSRPAQTTLVNPGSSTSPANLRLCGFNNSFGPFFTNQPPRRLKSGHLNQPNQLLLNLQVDLSQIFPVVGAINDSFDFTSIGTNASGV